MSKQQKIKKVELKAIKHSEFASQETHCYQANLYVNGKRIGMVGNDGHGGPDFFHAHKVDENDDWGWTENMATYELACEWVVEQMADGDLSDFYAQYPHEAMGSYCCDLVNEHLTEKVIKRHLKREICFIDPEREGVRNFVKVRPTKVQIERAQAKYPTYVILNALPVKAAVKRWLEAESA